MANRKNRKSIVYELYFPTTLNERKSDADCHPKRPSVPCSAVSV